MPFDKSKLADALLSSALDCIVVSDVQGRIVEFNTVAERTFGISRDEALGKSMETTIVPHRYREAHRKGMERYLSGGAPTVVGKRIEIEALHSSGRVFPVELSITEMPMDHSRYFVATLRDISEQKKAAAQLHETQATLKAVFDNIPAALYLRDRNDKLVMINNWGAEFLGHDPASMIGQPMSKFREPQNRARVQEIDSCIVRTGKSETHEFTYHLPGGNRVGLMTFFPVADDGGDVTHIGGMLLDVTELHTVRTELDQARASLQAFFDHAPIGIFINRIGPDGIFDQTVEFANDVVGKPYGLKGAQIVGIKPYTQFSENEIVPLFKSIDEKIVRTKAPVEHEMLNRYNNRYENYTRFPIINKDGDITHIGGVNIDVDDRLRSKKKLEETQAILKSIFDNIPAVLYLRELDGSFITVNNWGAVVIGMEDPTKIVGKSASTFDTPEEQEQARQVQEKLLATGMPATMEYRRNFEGREITVLNTIFPILDNEGAIAKIGGFAIDVTELHNARNQLQQAQENLHQSEKLAALGRLLAGVAHELNNPLAVVLGRAAILQEKLSDTAHAAPMQKLREAADRCARIVRTFLAMARQSGPRRQLAKVNDLIDSALEMTTYSLRMHNIAFNKTLLTDGFQIEVDQDQIVQVLINLILNAQQAFDGLQGNHTLDVNTEMSADGQWLNIAIVDNGPGVPAAIASRVFDPFFTTKPVGQGTGLGLSVCKSMVEAHGGTLKLETTPGGGATFRIALPAGQMSASGNQDESASETPLRLQGRVLVVDDEVEIAAILVDSLVTMGLECVIAADGHAAFDQLAKIKFDAIFCDVSMPGMDGITFYNKLMDVNPALANRLVFVSGDVLHRDWDRLKATIDRPIIEKPFDPQQVRDAALRQLTQTGGQR